MSLYTLEGYGGFGKFKIKKPKIIKSVVRSATKTIKTVTKVAIKAPSSLINAATSPVYGALKQIPGAKGIVNNIQQVQKITLKNAQSITKSLLSTSTIKNAVMMAANMAMPGSGEVAGQLLDNLVSAAMLDDLMINPSDENLNKLKAAMPEGTGQYIDAIRGAALKAVDDNKDTILKNAEVITAKQLNVSPMVTSGQGQKAIESKGIIQSIIDAIMGKG